MHTFIIKGTRSVLFFGVAVVCFLVFTPLFYLCALLPEKIRYTNKIYYGLFAFMNKLIIASAGIIIVPHGFKKDILFAKPRIFIANHPSTLDASLLDSLFGTEKRMWIIKSAFKTIPLWGFILHRLHLFVARENAKAAAFSVAAGMKKSRQYESHLLLFPEGTRTDNKQIYPFKPGYVGLAKNLNRSIFCIGIFANEHVLTKKNWFSGAWKTYVDVVVSPEFKQDQYASPEELQAAVQKWYQEKFTLYNRTRSSYL